MLLFSLLNEDSPNLTRTRRNTARVIIENEYCFKVFINPSPLFVGVMGPEATENGVHSVVRYKLIDFAESSNVTGFISHPFVFVDLEEMTELSEESK